MGLLPSTKAVKQIIILPRNIANLNIVSYF